MLADSPLCWTRKPGIQAKSANRYPPGLADLADLLLPCAHHRYEMRLHARVGLVRPLLLHRILADLLRLPCADIADLAVVLVVPALPWYRIGDGLAQLMRAGRGQCVQRGHAPQAAAAIGERHHRVEDAAVDGLVVATERLARAAAALHHGHARLQVHEVQHIRPRLRKRRVGGNLLLEHVLDGVVADRVVERRLGDRRRADALAMPNLSGSRAVLAELVYQ